MIIQETGLPQNRLETVLGQPIESKGVSFQSNNWIVIYRTERQQQQQQHQQLHASS